MHRLLGAVSASAWPLLSSESHALVEVLSDVSLTVDGWAIQDHRAVVSYPALWEIQAAFGRAEVAVQKQDLAQMRIEFAISNDSLFIAVLGGFLPMFDLAVRLIRSMSVRSVLAGTLSGLFLMSLLPVSLNAARGEGKTEVLPMQTAAPAAVVIEATGNEMELRRQLRTKNGVTELSAPASGIRFSVAPTGSYGFITPRLLGLALITQSPDLPLEATPPVANAYEIHKLADGSGMLVGFVAAELKPLLTPSQRPKNVRLSMHSNPSEKTPYIVAVPLVKLVVDQMPLKLDPKKQDSAVSLDMDLQGTANRKSSQTGPN